MRKLILDLGFCGAPTFSPLQFSGRSLREIGRDEPSVQPEMAARVLRGFSTMRALSSSRLCQSHKAAWRISWASHAPAAAAAAAATPAGVVAPPAMYGHGETVAGGCFDEGVRYPNHPQPNLRFPHSRHLHSSEKPRCPQDRLSMTMSSRNTSPHEKNLDLSHSALTASPHHVT